MGAEVEPFWPLVRFTPYAVQIRYEESPANAEDPLDRSAIVAEVQALLRHISVVIGETGT